VVRGDHAVALYHEDKPISNALREIDGAWGEGGGQLIRTAVALAAITHTPIRVRHVRANRQPPGLAPQHLTAVRAVATLCGGETRGLELRATGFAFAPGPIVAGEFRFDVGTAGSLTLLAQALLPVLASAPGPCMVRLIGGTDVRAAPPFDYFRQVLLAHLAALGVPVRCTLHRRGYYPRGGGDIELVTQPARPRARRFDAATSPRAILGRAHTDHLPRHVATRMSDAARTPLSRQATEIEVEVAAEAANPGGSIVLWTHDGGSVLGAGRVAERGVRAEVLGAAVGAELAADLAAGIALDVHSADQLLVWLALADGESAFTTRAVTPHARTAIWLIEQFVPVRFEIASDREAGARRVRVRVRPQR
jgi:RNA 3'-phosphate cyclase